MIAPALGLRWYNYVGNRPNKCGDKCADEISPCADECGCNHQWCRGLRMICDFCGKRHASKSEQVECRCEHLKTRYRDYDDED